jgi:hypothetical protein
MQHPKKLAIFVEGQTEQIFIEKLLLEIVGHKRISIGIFKVIGGKSNRQIITVNPGNHDKDYYVLLYDCGSDSQVLSDIRKQYGSLVKNGYVKFIGIRDLYPKSLNELSQFETSIKAFLKQFIQGTIPVAICLAVMEVEAWFLAEWNHFLKIDTSLTPEFIEKNCGLNPEIVDVEQRTHPSQDLDDIYRLVNRKYDKDSQGVKDLVNILDYEFIYLHVVNKVKYLGYLIKEIDDFLIENKA